MPEPTSHAAAVAAAAGASTAVGTFFGIEYLALMWGFVGGITALIYLPPFKDWRAIVFSLAGATIIGGISSPIGSFAALHYWPWLIDIKQILTIVAAFAVGLTAQILVPAIFNRIKTKVGDAQ